MRRLYSEAAVLASAANPSPEDSARLAEICETGQFPGTAGAFSDRGIAAEEAAEYAKHNITHTHFKGVRGNGMKFEPNSHADQCQCAKCNSHRRRAGRTQTADKGKDVQVN